MRAVHRLRRLSLSPWATALADFTAPTDTNENRASVLGYIIALRRALVNVKEGQRIYHKRFGEGNISKIEPEGDDLKLDIQFDKVGHKRLMAKFANLEIID